jgi:tetratricopeptide (TPR) repeat protein
MRTGLHINICVNNIYIDFGAAIAIAIAAALLLPVNVTAQETPAELSVSEQLDDANARFISYYEDGLYGRAQIAAQQTVLLARDLHGNESVEMALALSNLATSQTRTGELVAARSNYEASIYLVEKSEGIVSPSLINPLMGLAATHNAMGAYDRGLQTYQRALRINHVELGLNNIEQMPIRDGLTDSYVALGENGDATDQQEIQMRIVRQEFSDDPDKLIAAMYKLADWYRRSYQPEMERLHMEKSVRIIRRSVGDDADAQISALRGLAGVYQRLDMHPNAIRTLKQALRINADREPAENLLGADIQVEIGDFYNAFGDARGARKYYIAAAQTLKDASADEALIQAYFGMPVNIWQVELPPAYPTNSKTRELLLNNPDEFQQGSVLLEYDIDHNGRVKNVRVVEADPAEMLEKKVAYLITRYIYRPRLDTGTPVTTTGIRLQHSFSYRSADNEANEAGATVNKSDSNSSGRLEYPAGF